MDDSASIPGNGALLARLAMRQSLLAARSAGEAEAQAFIDGVADAGEEPSKPAIVRGDDGRPT